jgi:hypothetical protein
MATGEIRSGYTVRAEHPESGLALEERYAGIPAAIARAVELLREGYAVEIRSVAPR